ncbi:MAG: Xaa-Pro peptidase family protein [Dehalococcoidia bacterium]
MVELSEVLRAAAVRREPAFPKAEYEARVAKVKKAMGEQGIDVLLVHHTPNFCYLYGYQSPLANWYGCLILPLEGEPIAHVIDIEVANLMVHGWDTDNIYTFDWRWQVDAPGQLVEILQKRGLADKRIGLEFRLPGCNALTGFELRDRLPQAQIVDASDVVLYFRAVKSPAELAHIHEAARITDIGMKAGLEAIGPGKTDNDMFQAAVGAMAGAGSEYLSIQPLAYVGPWTTLTHVTAKRRLMKTGDTATVELTGVYHRYSAPLFRTGVVGQPSDLVKRLADYVIARMEILYSNARPGRAASEVANAVAEGAKGIEPPEAREQRLKTGRSLAGNVYTVGIGFPPDWVEHSTFISEKHDRPLEPGMVFHTPTGAGVLNQIGVSFSETMVITETGCETLSKLPRELTVV